MIFIGDCHGKTPELCKLVLPMVAAIQLGDMGLGFKGVYLPHLDNLKFIRGNHDDPAACRAHPCYLGDYGYAEELELFYLGGAWSIDWQYRVEGKSWWPDEELPHQELHKAFQLYVEKKPRIVATHEAPTRAALYMLNSLTKLGSIGHEACPTDQEVLEKDEAYTYYKAKLGCAETRTSQILQQMWMAHQPRYWVFGHYHLDTTFLHGGTEFSCLNELSVKEIK